MSSGKIIYATTPTSSGQNINEEVVDIKPHITYSRIIHVTTFNGIIFQPVEEIGKSLVMRQLVDERACDNRERLSYEDFLGFFSVSTLFYVTSASRLFSMYWQNVHNSCVMLVNLATLLAD